MRAARLLEGRNDFEVMSVDDPDLRPGAVVVAVENAFLPTYFKPLAEGLFQTPRRPFTTGQCAVGRVAEVGAGITDVTPGQRVYCDLYLETPGSGVAEDYGFIGCFGLGAASTRLLESWPDGSFAEKVLLPRECLVPVPEEIEAAPAVLCRLGWLATAYAGLVRGGFTAGSRLAVNGASGLLGASAVLVALSLGAGEIHLFGRRREILEELTQLNPRVTIGRDKVPFDFVLDCAGGCGTARTEALIGRLRRGGAMTFVGALSAPLAVDGSLLMRAGLRLQGSFWFPRATPAKLLRLISGGALDLTPLKAQVFPLTEINEALAHSLVVSGGLHHVSLECHSPGTQ